MASSAITCNRAMQLVAAAGARAYGGRGHSAASLARPPMSALGAPLSSSDHATRTDGMLQVPLRGASSLGRRSSCSRAMQRVLSSAAFSDTATVSAGDEVEVHYTGTLEDGTEFDASDRAGNPLKFKVGGGRLIAGFDDAVIGLAVGEQRKVTVEPSKAYGERRDDMIVRIPLADAPGDYEKGQQVQLSNGMAATVTDVTDDHVEIDANHVLAGKALTFDVEIVSITSPGDRFPLKKTDTEWKSLLNDFEFKVLRQKGTEPAGSGKYDKFSPTEGHFVCRGCEAPLYSAEAKFNSGCGWPAFDKCYKDSVAIEVDNSMGMRRVEIMCNNCGGHLGHVFEGEGMTHTNERHCVNSASVKYVEAAAPEGLEEAKVV